jgi:hypothetical protein
LKQAKLSYLVTALTFLQTKKSVLLTLAAELGH